jgi:Skp family chaperone for outer membrane proteins
LTLALGVALLLPLSGARGADGPTTAPASIRIGTASVQDIFDHLDETRKIKAALDDRQQQVKQQAQDLNKKIQDLQTDMSLATKNSRQYADDSQAMVKDKIDLEVLIQTTNADIEQQNKVQLKRVFDEIRAAVQAVAKADGYNLIIDIVTPELPSDADLDSVHPDQLSLIINQRTVLYTDGTNDISREVEAKMNADFAKQPN